ncbi:uncharacterized protein [Temnothorax nylanderi]|uniref:uncharacterized protein n=1 Tax=Temnothorax nylanderi TaxID=102681 RepID=UPI003A8A813D
MGLPVTLPEVQARRKEAELRFPQWALRRMDEDLLRASIHTSLWVDDLITESEDVDAAAEWIGGVMKVACDVAMPRSRPHPRKAAYWWTEEIAELRRSSVQARRRWLRARRAQHRQPRRFEEAGVEYRSAKRAYSWAIKLAKDKSWLELPQDLHEDPWKRPYKMVLKKLRTSAPPITESMEPEFLEKVIDTLFPDDPRERAEGGPTPPDTEWDEELEVSMDELKKAAKRLKAGKAPGPDGVPGKA